MKKIPVILDTDIGTDIDDTWALGLLLQCPELDLKLVTTVSDNTEYRAKIVANFLIKTGNERIPIGSGMGRKKWNMRKPQAKWIKGCKLNQYPGGFFKNGVQKLIDTILQSPEPITVIAIGPLSNIAEAYRIAPEISKNMRLIGMEGSVYMGYDGKPTPAVEYNIRRDINAAKAVFKSKIQITITPVDTCGLIRLKGDRYQQIYTSDSLVCRLILENYRLWDTSKSKNFMSQSSVLFDTVAIYLAVEEKLVEMEDVGIEIDDQGMMHVSLQAPQIRAAIRWKDLNQFEEWLVNRLTCNIKL